MRDEGHFIQRFVLNGLDSTFCDDDDAPRIDEPASTAHFLNARVCLRGEEYLVERLVMDFLESLAVAHPQQIQNAV